MGRQSLGPSFVLTYLCYPLHELVHWPPLHLAAKGSGDETGTSVSELHPLLYQRGLILNLDVLLRKESETGITCNFVVKKPVLGENSTVLMV